MNTFEHPAPAGDSHLTTIGNMNAGLSAIEAELAAIGVGDSGSVIDSRWDGAVTVLVLPDDRGDDVDSLKDELDMFRRENDFDLD